MAGSAEVRRSGKICKVDRSTINNQAIQPLSNPKISRLNFGRALKNLKVITAYDTI
jgi:hypothetical protein